MAELTKYGPWVGGDDWRSWVGMTITSETATSVTFKVRGWMDVGPSGDSDNASNIKGWVGYELNGEQTWGSAHNVGDFDPNDGWYYDTGTSWTIAKTKSTQTLWGGAWVEAYEGYYSGSVSKAWVSASIAAITHYTVSFNANGGSGAPDAQTKWYGETLTLSSTKPTRTGYTFSGWNTKADGSGTNYASGGSYTGNAALTLYAKWTANTYTMTYKANGGTGSDQTQTKTYGVDATVKAANTFSRTNYRFVSWKGSDGSTYAAGSKYAKNAAITLSAQWQLITYSVTYDANGGTGAPAAQTKSSGTTLKLSSTVPTYSGYDFLGWATTKARADAGTVDYAAGANYTANAAATLYAAWEVAAPTVTIVSAYRSSGSPDWEPADDGIDAVVTINAESQTGAALSFSVTVGSVTVTTPSATSGSTYTFHLAEATPSADESYAVSVMAQDTKGSTTKTTVISSAWYAIDVKKGGHGIAFGKVASEDQLADFGMSLRSERGASGNTYFTARRTDTDKEISFGIGSGGTNRGMWDETLSKWLIYVNSSGETVYNNTPHKGTTTVSLSNVASASSNHVYNNGIVAQVTIGGFKLSEALASNGSVTIGTVPEGYRPPLLTYAVIATNGTTSGRLYVQISTAGVITLYNRTGASVATTVTLALSATYII